MKIKETDRILKGTNMVIIRFGDIEIEAECEDVMLSGYNIDSDIEELHTIGGGKMQIRMQPKIELELLIRDCNITKSNKPNEYGEIEIVTDKKELALRYL